MYEVVHPLDDAPEEKHSIEGRTPIPAWLTVLLILHISLGALLTLGFLVHVVLCGTSGL